MHHSTISCMDQEPHFLAQHKVIESRNSAATVQAVCELWPDLHRKVPRTLSLGPPHGTGATVPLTEGTSVRDCAYTSSRSHWAESCGYHAHRLLPRWRKDLDANQT